MEKWKHLRSSDELLPPLLVKASFSKNGYSICLTDLSRIWVEKLDKSEIVARARRHNCSIDPSEDAEQYGILLKKVQSVLQQHSNTKLAISSTNDDNLKLHLEAPLPTPLPAFEWEVILERDHEGRIEDDLVSPLLQQAHNLNHHMQILITEIQAKDKIIAKIADRLESSGHGLSAVFPGLANVKLDPRKPQQEQYARHVRGLGEFDKDAWDARIAAGSDNSPINKETTDAVFASVPTYKSDNAARMRKEHWWQSIPRGRHIALNEDEDEKSSIQSTEARHLQGPDVRSEPDIAQDEDEFQRQATPPHLRAHPPVATTNGDVEMAEAADHPPQDEDSTEDEDDLDAPPQRPKASHHQARRTQTETRSTAKTPSPSPIPSSIPAPTKSLAPPSTNRGPFTHDEDTEEDDDDDLDKPSQPSPQAPSTSQLPSRQRSQTPQPTTPAAPSPRKRLGTLGGRARTRSATPVSPIEERENDKEASPPPKQTTKPKAKLGTIGGRSKSKPTQPVSSVPASDETTSTPRPAKKLGTIGGKRTLQPSRNVTPSPATPEPEWRKEPTTVDRKREAKTDPSPVEPEDAVERANAKRDELKRELAEKAKAPVKKKRKF